MTSGPLDQEAGARLRHEPAPLVALFLAQEGLEMLQVSRILMRCGLSLTEAKQAIDESGAWPGRSEVEGRLLDPKYLDALEGWDPESAS